MLTICLSGRANCHQQNLLERNCLINLEASLSSTLTCYLKHLCLRYVKIVSNALSIIFASLSTIGLTKFAFMVLSVTIPGVGLKFNSDVSINCSFDEFSQDSSEEMVGVLVLPHVSVCVLLLCGIICLLPNVWD